MVQFTFRVVVFRFHYSVFSTYNFGNYKFLYQHELVSLVANRKLVTLQLSCSPLGCTGSALCASCVSKFCGYLFGFVIVLYWLTYFSCDVQAYKFTAS